MYKKPLNLPTVPPMSRRNLLLLIEPTPSALVAKEVACGIAAFGNCTMTGLQIYEDTWLKDVSAPPTSLKSTLVSQVEARIGGSTESRPATGDDQDEILARQNIYFREKSLTGPRYALLSEEAERNDLTLLGREGNFEEQSENAREVISLLLQYRPRPIIVTPPNSSHGNNVLVAYDGSPRASRALQLFVLLGLAEDKNIHLLSVDRKPRAAEARMESVTGFLAQHEIEVTPHIISARNDPTDVIFETIKETSASMVVAGAQGTTGWRQTMFGSIGDYLIRHCPVPLFTCP